MDGEVLGEVRSDTAPLLDRFNVGTGIELDIVELIHGPKVHLHPERIRRHVAVARTVGGKALDATRGVLALARQFAVDEVFIRPAGRCDVRLIGGDFLAPCDVFRVAVIVINLHLLKLDIHLVLTCNRLAELGDVEADIARTLGIKVVGHRLVVGVVRAFDAVDIPVLAILSLDLDLKGIGIVGGSSLTVHARDVPTRIEYHLIEGGDSAEVDFN